MRGLWGVFGIAVAGSAAGQEMPAAPTWREQIVLAPDAGVRRSASAGDVIIEKRGIVLRSGAKLLSQATPPPKVSNTFVIPIGGELRQVDSRAPFKACWDGKALKGGSPCLLDDDGDGIFDRASSDEYAKAHPLIVPVRYERVELVTGQQASTLNRKILYHGADESTLKLGYRELSQDLARPAFNEDLSIPISKDFPQKVAAKGVVITIFKIDGMGLAYQVDSTDGF